MKYVVLSLMVIFSASCGGNKNPNFLELEEEDIAAKELLQGIWLDDETESPLMRVEGDTIYYADSQSAPITFKAGRYAGIYGNDTGTPGRWTGSQHDRHGKQHASVFETQTGQNLHEKNRPETKKRRYRILSP